MKHHRVSILPGASARSPFALDPDVAALRAKELDATAADVATRQEIIYEVLAAEQAGNAELSRVEQIKRFTIRLSLPRSRENVHVKASAGPS